MCNIKNFFNICRLTAFSKTVIVYFVCVVLHRCTLGSHIKHNRHTHTHSLTHRHKKYKTLNATRGIAAHPANHVVKIHSCSVPNTRHLHMKEGTKKQMATRQPDKIKR